jgi:hypothetical protein
LKITGSDYDRIQAPTVGDANFLYPHREIIGYVAGQVVVVEAGDQQTRIRDFGRVRLRANFNFVHFTSDGSGGNPFILSSFDFWKGGGRFYL